jgi:GNAT superfamily N-acetyltransferase
MSDFGQLDVDARRRAKIHVRNFDPRSDLEICQQIYQTARAFAFYWIDPKKFRLRDFSADIKGESIGVAEELNCGVVGFVGIWLPDNFIHHLYVSPERHRRGIGKALLDHALAQVGRPARLKCQRQNRNACQFYRHLGWRPGETGYDSIGDWIEFIFD